MINKHQFQLAAKSFRAGRISLQQFTDQVFTEAANGEPVSESGNTSSNLSAAIPTELGTERLPELPTRKQESHKGDFGRLVLIGGAQGMSGAISLAGLASLKSGSGLVKVAVPAEIQSVVAGFSPCYMTIGCLSERGEFHGAALDGLEEIISWSDVVGIGPGLDRGPAQQWIVPQLFKKTEQPLVVDADGLNALSDAGVDFNDHAGQRILTPHPGEFQRLLGRNVSNRSELEALAHEFAGRHRLVVILKGNQTLVTDGNQTYRNDNGNPGMATAGSGDVLTGIVTSLVGQGLTLFKAAVLAVYVHGKAGDLAADGVGQVSLIASDLLDYLPAAFKSLKTANRVIGFSR